MNVVTVSNLSKAYGRIQAVSDFSFEVARGEIYMLVGPDGAGKTTIIRTLCNLLSPDRGALSINDLDVFRQFGRIKPILGYMPQVFSLYPDLTIRENLTFYGGIFGVVGDEFRRRCDYLYRFSNLKPFAERRARDISGGMKQKLALSCALMHNPQVLLLDEPTTGVDPLSRQQFWEILFELKRGGVTIIATTPYMDEVARADRACFVFGGKKLAEGSPEELTELFDGRAYFLDRAPATAVIERLNRLENMLARRFGAGLHLCIGNDTRIDDYAEALAQFGINAADVTAVEPSLEDCFIQLMGGSS